MVAITNYQLPLSRRIQIAAREVFMPDSIQVSTVLPASPARIYKAWLSSKAHTAMTGGEATVDPKVGGRHTAWNGYIEGVTLDLKPNRRIVQSWRSTEFPADVPDSRLEILLETVEGGTTITLNHSEIPAGQGVQYESGWVESYFDPMRVYFARKAPTKRPRVGKAKTDARILTKHPEKGKQGVRISKAKYEVIRDAIVRALHSKREMTFEDLGKAVNKALKGKFEGSISWYVTTVKLDLEARKVLRRVPKSSPQRIRLAKKA